MFHSGQVNFAEMSYEELYEMFIPSDGRIKGASDEFLKTLPQHVITRGNLMDASGDAICCAICLQVVTTTSTDTLKIS